MGIPISEPNVGTEEIEAVIRTMKRGQFSGRSGIVKKFEKRFPGVILGQDRNCVAVSTGTDALLLALLSAGVGLGDKVVLPVMSYVACVNSVLATGAVPVFVDCASGSWNPGEEDIDEALVETGAKYLLVVHNYGEVFDPPIDKYRKDGVFVIEDCAEAMWHTYESGGNCGIASNVSIFSLYPNKLITAGEGGMVAFHKDRSDLVERARTIANNGCESGKGQLATMVGYNMRMSSMQAALGLSQLDKVEENFIMRQAAMRKYYERLSGHVLAIIDFDKTPVPWLFGIRLESIQERDGLRNHLTEKGVETRVPFPLLSELEPYKEYAHFRSFPKARTKQEEWLFLPSGPMITGQGVDFVCEEVEQFMRRG